MRRSPDELIWVGVTIRGWKLSNLNVINLDFWKAYDTVPDERLLVQLKKYGFSGNLWNWIRSFLINHKMRVIVGGVESS